MTITTTKSPQGRISVIISGRKGMDKVVESAFDAIDNGEEVILMNEHGDTCTLDDSLFLHGIYNVKFAIRQFAKGERVTGAIVLNGKEYPVVKAEVRRAEEERNRAMSYVNTSADAIDAAVEAEIELINNSAAEEIADKTVTFYPNATPKPCSGKLFGYDYCEYHSVDEYISELEFMQSAIIMERLFKNANGTYSYDGWGRKTYYMTDCYREAYYVACDTENVCLDAEDTANLIYIEQQLKNIVNGSDGSEEDIDGDNVFDYLPALDELQDVDIDDDDNTPPDNEPMSDDISDICKYNPDLEDDDKSCRLDWDDSAIAHIPTGEEELAEFNALPVIPAGTLEPVIIDNGKTYTEAEYFAKTAPDKIAAAKPKHSRRQLRDLIDSNLAEINHYLDGLDECSADENCPQSHIDFLHDKIKNLGKKYRQYYREYRDMHAEEIAG